MRSATMRHAGVFVIATAVGMALAASTLAVFLTPFLQDVGPENRWVTSQVGGFRLTMVTIGGLAGLSAALVITRWARQAFAYVAVVLVACAASMAFVAAYSAMFFTAATPLSDPFARPSRSRWR